MLNPKSGEYPQKTIVHAYGYGDLAALGLGTALDSRVLLLEPLLDRLGSLFVGALDRLLRRKARVYATARHVWNSDEDALAFLHAPHAMLGGQPPLEVAMTELGARRVETLLWRLFYGIAA